MASGTPHPDMLIGTIRPPPGVIPDYYNPPRDNGPLTSTVTCLTLALLFVSVRFTTNTLLLREFGWDDATCLIAMVLAVIYAVTNFELIHNGLGINLWNIPIGGFDPILWIRWTYVQDIIYSFALGFVKVSILLLYLKLFKVEKAVSRLVYCMITIISLYTVIIALITIFACHPINKLWDYLSYGYCLNSAAVGIALAALQIFSDVVILAIPVPIVLSLQLPARKRIAVMVVFLTGIVVTVASCVRLVFLIQIVNNPEDIDLPTSTLTVNLWSTLEIYLAIIISCMPSVRPFIFRLMPWIRQAYHRRYRYGFTPSSEPSSGEIRTRGSFFLRGGRRNQRQSTIESNTHKNPEVRHSNLEGKEEQVLKDASGLSPGSEKAPILDHVAPHKLHDDSPGSHSTGSPVSVDSNSHPQLTDMV